jgi:hypothetical protein
VGSADYGCLGVTWALHAAAAGKQIDKRNARMVRRKRI